MFIIQVLGLVCCLFIFDLKSVVPESVLLFIFSFYVFVIDLVFYLAALSIKWKTALTFVGVVIIGLLFSGKLLNFHHYKLSFMKKQEKYIETDIPDMKLYYDGWKQRIIHRKDSTKPYPIILISGEGGGSRAGLWFSQSIINFDMISNGKFKDHVFSMSTVSGSSVGLGAILSYWTYCKEKNVANGDRRWFSYPQNIFKYNFVGSSILGLTVTDLSKSLIPVIEWSSNRNVELQVEEASCIQRSLLESNTNERTPPFTLFNKKAEFDDPESFIMNRDFMSFYYQKMDSGIIKIKTDLPLCFINTCRSSDGRRGVFAPIRINSSDFMDALDMCRYIYCGPFHTELKEVKGLKKSITLGAACNTSELFPLLSAPALIDGLGYFVDGGYHDNSGLKTTLEIYNKLSGLLESDSSIKKNDYTISIVYLKNGKYEKKYYPDSLKTTLPGLQPIVAISNIPFSGNASYFEEVASHRLKDNFFRFQLNYGTMLDSSIRLKYLQHLPKSIQDEMLDDIYDHPEKGQDTTLNLPLARWLSNYIIQRIIFHVGVEYIQEPNFQELINIINPRPIF